MVELVLVATAVEDGVTVADLSVFGVLAGLKKLWMDPLTGLAGVILASLLEASAKKVETSDSALMAPV